MNNEAAKRTLSSFRQVGQCSVELAAAMRENDAEKLEACLEKARLPPLLRIRLQCSANTCVQLSVRRFSMKLRGSKTLPGNENASSIQSSPRKTGGFPIAAADGFRSANKSEETGRKERGVPRRAELNDRKNSISRVV